MFVWPLPSKAIMPTCRNFDIYLHAKKRTPCLTTFKDIVKTRGYFRLKLSPTY